MKLYILQAAPNTPSTPVHPDVRRSGDVPANELHQSSQDDEETPSKSREGTGAGLDHVQYRRVLRAVAAATDGRLREEGVASTGPDGQQPAHAAN